jgi:hypothetical protein
MSCRCSVHYFCMSCRCSVHSSNTLCIVGSCCNVVSTASQTAAGNNWWGSPKIAHTSPRNVHTYNTLTPLRYVNIHKHAYTPRRTSSRHLHNITDLAGRRTQYTHIIHEHTYKLAHAHTSELCMHVRAYIHIYILYIYIYTYIHTYIHILTSVVGVCWHT